MGSLLCCCCYGYDFDEDVDLYTKQELLKDNILLSYKVVGLKKQKVCTLCMKLLEDQHNADRSTSKEAKSPRATYGTASLAACPRTSSSPTPAAAEKGWSILP